MQLIQQHWGDLGWKSGYINAGVWMTSRQHRDVFSTYNGKLWNTDGLIKGYCGEQSHFGWLTQKAGHKVHGLPFKFNHMSMFSESWNNSAHRYDSHIIHYAGGGRFADKGKRTALELAQHDMQQLWP